MIDPTDRSLDVLVRFERASELYRPPEDIDIPAWQKAGRETELHLWNLMADLATMVRELSLVLEAIEHRYRDAKDQRLTIMREAEDETGARLFPDPAER